MILRLPSIVLQKDSSRKQFPQFEVFSDKLNHQFVELFNKHFPHYRVLLSQLLAVFHDFSEDYGRGALRIFGNQLYHFLVQLKLLSFCEC